MQPKGWEPSRKRWCRMYQGKRFKRTPEQLGLPPDKWTKKGSYPAFMAWFKEAVKEFEKTGKIPPPPKKPKKPRPSRARFVAWRDDPEYPSDAWSEWATEVSSTGIRKPRRPNLDTLRRYTAMVNDLINQENEILKVLRSLCRSGHEFKKYMRKRDKTFVYENRGQPCRTLEEHRFRIEVTTTVLELAKVEIATERVGNGTIASSG